MAIQIFGTKKCKRTQKVKRFFSDRNIQVHFVDLTQKEMSKGELEKVVRVVGLDSIIDTESKEYTSKGYAYMDFDPFEEALENQKLLNTPIVRNGLQASVGDAEEIWKKWIKEGIK